ncbi:MULTISPECIES: nucleotidyl transferase AbiEii/AbiGii toxin family protein [unclassified Variovorax]|uniref:nucleotidyl transferase AbiEii/AbiGii toxin family protein n=1 Tax=unclassified Variovorax TaxID=663243 RepID=UPI00211BE65A|nr:nucleotidyl transferase AbiEii/AbiGii toxin family protein [Variovorax sp. YR752]
MKQEYIDTVRLLIDIAPTIFSSSRFAMKGGTTLNLFVQDMPRLSVDIDVVFTDHPAVRGRLACHRGRPQGGCRNA